MPYDTPYNQMIAHKRNNSNRAYSDINAYSNQMANGRGKFDEARVRFPDRDGTTQFDTAQIINPDDTLRRVHFDGGITHRNLEGSGGVLGNTFRGIGYGVDAKMAEYHRRFCNPPRPQSGSGKYSDSESESDESCSDEEMEGDGFLDSLVSGAKTLGKDVLSDPSKYINMAKQGYETGKQAYDFAKPLFKKGKGMSGSAQNMSLSIRPFDSPQEQAVFRNYASTSGPIGGAEPPAPPRMTKMTQALIRPEPRRPNAPVAAAEPPPKKAKEGGKRPLSAWIVHCKKFAAAKGISYRDAIRSPECKSSYHSSKKSGGNAVIDALKKIIPGRTYMGGSVIGGPSNDPVNRGKITGGGRKKKQTGSALFAPRGEFPLTQKTSDVSPADNAMSGGAASTEFPQKYMKTTGHKWEGATLGAGMSGGFNLMKWLRSCFGKKKFKLENVANEVAHIVTQDGVKYSIPIDTSGTPISNISAYEVPNFEDAPDIYDKTPASAPKIVNTGYDTLEGVRNEMKAAKNPIYTDVKLNKSKKEAAAAEENPFGEVTLTTDQRRKFSQNLKAAEAELSKLQAKSGEAMSSREGAAINAGIKKLKAEIEEYKRKLGYEGKGKRRGKGAMGYPIITPARIRAVRQKTGGMLKQQMRSSSVSGGGKKKVSAVEPAGYPANANITGFGKRVRRSPAHKAALIQRLMEHHSIPKTKAAKMLSAMSPLAGKGFFGDLWDGVKNVGKTALHLAPELLPLIL